MALEKAPYNWFDIAAPSDTDDLPRFKAAGGAGAGTSGNGLTEAVFVGTGGDVAFVRQDGIVVQWPSVPSGAWLPIAVRRINQTNTTASQFVVCYIV